MKLQKLSLLIFASFTFISCLIYKQELNIFSDGSATLNISYSIDQQALKNLSDLHQASGGTANINYFDEKAIKEYLDSFTEIKSHSVRAHSDKKRSYVDVKIEINNLRKALNSGLIPYARLSKNKENWRFSYSTPYDLGSINKVDAQERINRIKMKISINTPSDIIASSNENFSKRSVTWSFSPEDKKQLSTMPNSFFVEFSGEKISFE
jgi:hypothetical protein